MEDSSSINYFDYLNTDITQLILSKLPIKSIVCCSAVCKLFRSITVSNTFPTTAISAATTPWFFLYYKARPNVRSNYVLGYDPLSNEWIKLPINHFPSPDTYEVSFTGSGGFFISTSYNTFRFSPILKPLWQESTPLRYDELAGITRHGFCLESRKISGFQRDFDLELNFQRFIFVGFIGQDSLVVEIYNCGSNSWEICPSLPTDFRIWNSVRFLMWVSYKSRFYIYSMKSGCISYFDLDTWVWSDVKILRSPYVLKSFLISCGCNLMLGGFCYEEEPEFNLWLINEVTLELSEFATMPRNLLTWLLDRIQIDPLSPFKCFGFGNFLSMCLIRGLTMLVFVKLGPNLVSVDGGVFLMCPNLCV